MSNTIFITTTKAGDVMKSGSVLTQDSYVFTIAEATSLMNKIKDYEVMELELKKYKDLEAIRIMQIDAYILNEGFYIAQTKRYKDLHLLDQELLDKFRKRDRLQTVENIGFLSLGVALTIGSFLLADAATDLAVATQPLITN